MIFITFLLAVSIVGMVLSLISIWRIGRLSSALTKAIDNTYELRMKAIEEGRTSKDMEYSIPYPNIEQSYKNLKWYKPWERTSTLVVFDKEQL